jgi:hypothetical protein
MNMALTDMINTDPELRDWWNFAAWLILAVAAGAYETGAYREIAGWIGVLAGLVGAVGSLYRYRS